jgi:hypothetical protein
LLRQELRKRKGMGFPLVARVGRKEKQRWTHIVSSNHDRMIVLGNGSFFSVVFHVALIFEWYFPELVIFGCYEINFPNFLIGEERVVLMKIFVTCPQRPTYTVEGGLNGKAD